MPSQSLASLSAGRDEALLGDHLQETPAVMATGDMRPRRQRMGACAQACVWSFAERSIREETGANMLWEQVASETKDLSVDDANLVTNWTTPI